MVRYENKHLVLLVIVFAGVIAAILFVNRWIAGGMKDLTRDPVERSAAPQAVEKTQQTTGPRHVVIDPANDPLAPVIPRKQPKSSAKKAAPRQTIQEIIYELSVDSVILTQ